MESTPSTFAVPIRKPHRYRRLLSLVGALVVLFSALWWLFLPTMAISSYFGLQIFIPASLSTALFVFAVVTALMDMPQGIRWLVVLAVVIAESLNFPTFELFALADYLDVNPALRESLQDQTVLHLVIGLAAVLAIHALLWPFRALLGWQVHWAGEAPAAKERLLTIWHLAGPVALVAILLVHSGSSTNPFLLSQFTTLLATLAVGLPVLILATRDKHVAFWIPGVLAGLIGLTLAETELTNLISPFAGWMDGFSLSRWGIWNGTVVGTVLFNFFLLRLAGLQFHLPISRPAAGLGQAPVEGTPANSYRRKYQFSLRSVFLLMTLLCLGPGSYIAWERDQCHRGSDALALTEKVLGKQNSTEQRPAWLQAVLGNHGYRQLRLAYTKRSFRLFCG